MALAQAGVAVVSCPERVVELLRSPLGAVDCRVLGNEEGLVAGVVELLRTTSRVTTLVAPFALTTRQGSGFLVAVSDRVVMGSQLRAAGL